MNTLDAERLAELLSRPPFDPADRSLASALLEYESCDPWLQLACALTSARAREGHAYLDLSQAPTELEIDWPNLARWKGLLEASALVSDSSALAPLIYAQPNALYLQRHYSNERRAADRIQDLITRGNLKIITGGPGTGKTTRVLELLSDRLAASAQPGALRIACAAPTGKAAARLSESLKQGIDRLQTTPEIKERLLATECLTIHRLLGALPYRSEFRKNAQQPIDYDLLVVDEASMIDLSLMSKLLEATPESCELTLIGDADQLASVEVGSPFRDLLSASRKENSPLGHCVTRLTKTYRFSAESGVKLACDAARSGKASELIAAFELQRDDLRFQSVEPQSRTAPSEIFAQALEHHHAICSAANVESALQTLRSFSILAPSRIGAMGTESINARLLDSIRRETRLDSESIPAGVPIMILENDHDQELYNGDVGIVHPHPSDNGLYAWFEQADAPPKAIRLSYLPRHEVAFAITIHKSQGSEFDNVAILLPADNADHLTRELAYTAFSRARKRITIYSDQKTLENAIERKASRATRLDRLL